MNRDSNIKAALESWIANDGRERLIQIEADNFGTLIDVRANGDGYSIYRAFGIETEGHVSVDCEDVSADEALIRLAEYIQEFR